MRLPILVALAATAGCARGGALLESSDAAAPGALVTPDAPGATQDAPASTPDSPASPPVDAAVQPPQLDAPADGGGGGVPTTLLLSEVVLAPSTGELVEIVNPGAAAVDLSTYYLSDNGNYFRLPAGAPVLDTDDFIVKFPAGASIPAHGVITVALDTAANFTSVYAVAPSYSIASGTMTMVASNGLATLTNAGELIALFRWDGQADLVKDVDLVVVGAATAANGLVNKSAVAIDGPDTGTTASAYAHDARTLAAQASTPAAGKSTKRLAPEAGHEIQTGSGNGVLGDDETSENTAATWDSSAFGTPTPGTVPAALMP